MTEQEEFAAFAATVIAPQDDTPAPVAVTTEAPKEVEVADKAEVSAEVAKEEPPKVVEPPKVEEKPKIDWKELAAKEKAKREAKHQARQQAEVLAREVAEAKKAKLELDELKALAGTDELKALERLGLTIDKVNTRYIKNIEDNPDTPPPAITAAQKEIAAMRAELAEIKQQNAKREAEQLTAKRTESLASLNDDIAKVMSSKPDDYEVLSRKKQGKEVVINLLAAQHETTGRYDIEEACRDAEEFFREQIKETADTKFIRSLVAPQSSSAGIAGNMRQSEPRGSSGSDEDNEFLATSLRLLKQSGG